MVQLKEKMIDYHGLTTHRIFGELEKRFQNNGNAVYMKDLKDASMQYFGTGKGFRPAFLFLFNQLFSEISDKAVDLAASIEVLHTSSLVHDDWMDQANIQEQRRFGLDRDKRRLTRVNLQNSSRGADERGFFKINDNGICDPYWKEDENPGTKKKTKGKLGL